jgi:RimJ/RimL family protein N-acetyltransferase
MTTRSQDDVRLRSWLEGDHYLLERTVGAPEMTEHLGGPESRDKMRERHQSYLATGEPGDGRMLVILAGADRVPAGTHGYWEREWQGQIVWETGWFVLPGFQGRGIATRATIAMAELAWADAPGRPIHAFPSVANLASNAVCRKAGFRLLGPIDLEYPAGDPLLCNDWVLEPRDHTLDMVNQEGTGADTGT